MTDPERADDDPSVGGGAPALILDRPDLDGLRLTQAGQPDVWLVFHGRRRRIVSTAVYDSLFGEVTRLVNTPDVEHITRGPDLDEGTCLIRADGDLAIHLLTRTADGAVRRHFVPTYESLLDFGFDETRVRQIPSLLVEGLAAGADLVSAADRAKLR